ncbi:MAG: PAS domain S-box protein [Desulfuromonadales bacterium]|nr:MAG: PAS domain S-box protein [Desulfuromonadales bacterium]
MRFSFGLKARMTLVVSALVAVLLSFTAFVMLSSFEKHFRETASHQQFTIISIIADEMDARIAQAHRTIIEGALQVTPALVADSRKAERFLGGLTEAEKLFNNGIYLFDARGVMVGEFPETGRVGSNFSFREYFQATLTSGKPYVSRPYLSSQRHRHPAIMFTAPVFDRSGKLIAVLSGSIDLFKDSLLSKIGKTKIGETGYLYLYNTDRTMIMHPDKGRILKQDVSVGANRLFDLAIGGFEGTGENVNSRGLRSLSSFKHLTATNWIIGANYPVAEAYAPFNRARRMILLILPPAILATVGVIALVMNYLTATLRLFAAHVEALPSKRGEEKFFRMAESHEIGILIGAFNRMVGELEGQRAAIVKSEELYRTVADFSSDFVFWCSPDRSVMHYVSPRCLPMTGWDEGEFYKNPLLIDEVVHADDFQRWQQHAATAGSGCCAEPLELRFVHRDGSIFWVRHHCLPVFSDDGSFLGVRGSFSDVSALKEVEDQQRQQLRFLQSLIDTIPNPIFYKDRAGRYRGCNKAFQDLLGLTREEIVGKTVFELSPEALPIMDHDVDQELRGEGGFQSYEGQVRAADGTLRDMLLFKTAFAGAGGNGVDVVGTMLDITRRKQAEDELRKVSCAVEQSPVSVIITDTYGTIEYVNHTFSTVTGFGKAEAIGRTPRFLQSGETTPEQYQELRKAILSGLVWRGEFRNRKKGGELYWARVSISPLRDSHGVITHFVGIEEDITDRKKLEGELRHSQKMEAVGRLAGGIAHDFNNILTAIIGHASILEMQTEEGSPLHNDIRQIVHSAERGATLTQGLLAYSRKQTINPRPVNVNDIVARVETLLRRVIGEDIELHTELGAENLVVRADSTQIEQVLMNLATNGRDAMPEGGRFSISTGWFAMDASFTVQHNFGIPGQYARICVADTGVGMDGKTALRVFEPYFTTKEVGKGTGLGLSMVYGIIKKHDGYITCRSELSRGTAFDIYLPLIETEAVPLFREISPLLAGGRETILVAEDDDSVRGVAVNLLAKLGYTVVEASDGDEAVARFRERADEISLLLLDVVMPKRNGRDVYDEVRRLRPEVKVIFVSGYTADIINRHGMLEDDIHFLEKPLSPGKLAAKVREVIDV